MAFNPPSQGPRVQTTVQARNRERRNYLTIALLAFLIGLAFSLFLGTLLWSLGYLHVGQVSCPDPKSECLTAAESLAVCPTCEVLVVTPTPTFTPSPTLTATPDIQATATAACQAFEQQFPLTPCPPLEPTATP